MTVHGSQPCHGEICTCHNLWKSELLVILIAWTCGADYDKVWICVCTPCPAVAKGLMHHGSSREDSELVAKFHQAHAHQWLWDQCMMFVTRILRSQSHLYGCASATCTGLKTSATGFTTVMARPTRRLGTSWTLACEGPPHLRLPSPVQTVEQSTLGLELFLLKHKQEQGVSAVVLQNYCLVCMSTKMGLVADRDRNRVRIRIYSYEQHEGPLAAQTLVLFVCA